MSLGERTGTPKTLQEQFLVLSTCVTIYKQELSTAADLSIRTVKECTGQVVTVMVVVVVGMAAYIYIHILIHGVVTSLPERRVSGKMSQYTKEKTFG
jgi:hypothetical protein